MREKLANLILLGVPLFFLNSITGAVVSALPYGTGTYGTCQYDSCSISVLSSGTVDLDVTPTTSGVHTTSEDEVTVSTEASTGYTLILADTDTDTDLDGAGDSIAASGGTQVSPVSLALNTWGYRVDGLASFGAGPTSSQASDPNPAYTFAGVPASNLTAHTIKTTSGPASPSDVTSVWYGVRIDTNIPSGIYTGQVTYTAVTNE